MTELQDMMTNEVLMSGRFSSQFELVSYAIKRITIMVKKGVRPKVRSSIGNPAYQILEEIAQKKDLLNGDLDLAEEVSEEKGL